VRVTIFRNRGRFGRFDEALALAARTGDAADTGLMRSRRSRAGIGINVEQAATDTLGVFARAGIADGQVEPYDFTDIDRTAQAGLSLRGAGWGRGGDTLGAVFIVNAISREHQRYLDAGGLGVLVGDGRLPNPGDERIGEAYYKVAAERGVDLTVDYQFIANPGYNRDRGPANVFAFRAHGAF
jgi:high affinity Mn2+ porin